MERKKFRELFLLGASLIVLYFIFLHAGSIWEFANRLWFILSPFLLGGAGELIFLWVGAGIFTLYIGYDWYKAQAYPKTLDNAVDSALDLYLDIINLFLKILRILAKARSDD